MPWHLFIAILLHISPTFPQACCAKHHSHARMRSGAHTIKYGIVNHGTLIALITEKESYSKIFEIGGWIMIGYIDGLSWAAVNVCNLQCQAGCISHYYSLAGVMLIGSVLSLLITPISD